MTTISLVANDQMLSVALKPKLASGDKNSVTLHVDFSSEWDGYAKSGVFFTSKDETPYEKVMTNGECTIPAEVLAEAGVLFIGVRGVNAGNNAVKTSSLVKYKISEGAPAGEGTEIEPTANVYQQLLTAYGKTEAEIFKEIADRKAAITAEENARKQADDVLEARMNTFTSLEEGSTTGDAELIDGRTDHTGKKWSNIGSHIRGVSDQLSGDMSMLQDSVISNDVLHHHLGSVNLFNVETFKDNTSLYNGDEVYTSGYGTSDYIPVINGKTIYFSMDGQPITIPYVTFYDADKNYIKNISYVDNYTIPSNAKYVRITASGFASEFEKLKIEYDKVTEYTPFVYVKDIVNTIGQLSSEIVEIKDGTKSVTNALNIVEELPILVGESSRTWTPTASGSFATVNGTASLEMGKTYIMITKANNIEYVKTFGVLKNGAWVKTSLGTAKVVENYVYGYYSPEQEGEYLAVIISDSAVNNEVIFENYLYDVSEYEISDFNTDEFTLKLISNTPEGYSYEDLKAFFEEYKRKNTSWYKGKKLTCLGDSWTAQDTFRTNLLNYFGFSNVINCGIGGTRLTGNGATAFASDDRINSIPLDTDVLTILGGANDSVYGTIGAGEISFDTTDLNSVSGAINVILSKIYYKFRITEEGYYSDIDYSNITRTESKKDILIFIGTCCGRYDGENYAKYTRAIANGTRDICNLWGIPVVDIARLSGINDVNHPLYLADLVHPNDEGDKLVSNVFINALLANEPRV